LVMAEICHVGEPAMLLGSDAPEEVATAINTLHLNPGLLTVRAHLRVLCPHLVVGCVALSP
jgi:hypothetical protein